MAFAVKYLFKFDSIHGTEYQIRLLVNDYSGEVIQRPLGRAPVLKKKQNGPICGTSLEFYAECQVDGELAELYTTDARKYRVDLYRGGMLIWMGFVCPELYSEPDIAPPYDVQIVATDGLGELKFYNYSARGLRPLGELIRLALGASGRNAAVYYATYFGRLLAAQSDLLSWYINIDYMDGKSYYDVLTRLLESLHATVTSFLGYWIIARENDVRYLTGNTPGNMTVVRDVGGTITTMTLPDVEETFGKMGVATLWPIGYSTTTIVPAKNKISVKSLWHLNAGLSNPEMTSTASWNISSTAQNTHFASGGRGFYLGDGVVSGGGLIYQRISMRYMKMGLKITVRAMASNTGGWAGNGYLAVYAVYQWSGGNILYGTARGWDSDDSQMQTVDLGRVEIGGGDMYREEITVEIPLLNKADAGNLDIILNGSNVFVSYANIEFVQEGGYEDNLLLNNGARDSENEVEIDGGRIFSEGLPINSFYQGFWADSDNNPITTFDAPGVSFVASNFLSFMALDRALSAAFVRQRIQGTFNFPPGMDVPPLLLRRPGQTSSSRIQFWIDTYQWDLYNEEVRISATSIPQGTLSVESETIVPVK